MKGAIRDLTLHYKGRDTVTSMGNSYWFTDSTRVLKKILSLKVLNRVLQVFCDCLTVTEVVM